MAEIFGVVSAGIGVAGVAAQFADGIRKLCQFCSDVREAPEEVRYAVNELGILTNLLSGMESQLRSHPVQCPAHGNFEPVLLFCQQGTQQIAAVFGELDADLAKRKKRSLLRAAWKRPELDRYLQKIERAKASLMLAHQMYTSTVMVARMDTLEAPLARLEALALTSRVSQAIPTTRSPRSSQIPSQPLSHKVVREPSPDATFPISSMIVNTRSSSAIHSRKKWTSSQTPYLNLRVPLWLLNRVWEFGVRRASTGWDIKLRAHRIVPENNELFLACHRGNIDQVRAILVSGEISAYDLNRNGQDTLGACISWFFDFINPAESRTEDSLNRFCDICKLLIESGAEVNARNNVGRNAVGIVGYSHDMKDRPNKYSHPEAVIRLLLHYDLVIDETDLTALDLLDPGPATLKLVREQLWPPWSTRPLCERARALLSGVEGCPILSLASYKAILGQTDVIPAWLECGDETRDRLTSFMMFPYCQAVVFDEQAEIEEWRYIYLKAFQHNIGLHIPTTDVWERTCTPMCFFIQGVLTFKVLDIKVNYVDPRANLEAFMKWIQLGMTLFITEVQAWGVDLVEFAVEERSTGRNSEDFDIWIPPYIDDMLVVRMINFEYGPRVEDWRVWLSNPLDEWAGEFWDMIEHPERSMPGAWTFEDNDYPG